LRGNASSAQVRQRGMAPLAGQAVRPLEAGAPATSAPPTPVPRITPNTLPAPCAAPSAGFAQGQTVRIVGNAHARAQPAADRAAAAGRSARWSCSSSSAPGAAASCPACRCPRWRPVASPAQRSSRRATSEAMAPAWRVVIPRASVSAAQRAPGRRRPAPRRTSWCRPGRCRCAPVMAVQQQQARPVERAPGRSCDPAPPRRCPTTASADSRGYRASSAASTCRNLRVLGPGVGPLVGAFQLDADGVVVASRPAAPGRHPGVPGAPVERHVLGDRAAPADEQMRGHPHPVEAGEALVGASYRAIQEQIVRRAAAEPARRQRNAVDHHQLDGG
jgi:hypothetical protein